MRLYVISRFVKSRLYCIDYANVQEGSWQDNTVKSRFNESRFNIKSRFRVQNVVTKMKFCIKKSLFSEKSWFKESKSADKGHSLNRDFTVFVGNRCLDGNLHGIYLCITHRIHHHQSSFESRKNPTSKKDIKKSRKNFITKEPKLWKCWSRDEKSDKIWWKMSLFISNVIYRFQHSLLGFLSLLLTLLNTMDSP